jgi:hypothetical protein
MSTAANAARGRSRADCAHSHDRRTSRRHSAPKNRKANPIVEYPKP